MTKHYHFIVRFDEYTKEWSVDPETLDAFMESSVIWDGDLRDWLSYHDDESLKDKFVHLEDTLAEILGYHNDLQSKPEDLTN